MHGKRLTTEEYIEKCKKFNPEYDYSEIGFTTISGQYVTPICKKHGKFKINAKGLMTKHINCPECEKEKRFLSKCVRMSVSFSNFARKENAY